MVGLPARSAAETGLATGVAADRVRAQGLDQLAAVVMAEEQDEQVLLYARWLIWVFCLDDYIESHSSTRPITALFIELLARTDSDTLLDPPPTRGGKGPLVTAFAELWQQTSRGMGRHWRAEVPPVVAAHPLWQALTVHVCDAANWCNDLLSQRKDAADQVTMNYLLVVSRDLGLDGQAALAQRVPGEDLDLTQAAVRNVCRVACALRNFPAAFLTWALDSSRYT